MRFALAATILGLTGCVSTVPIVLSGTYTLPGGKGIVQIQIPLSRAPLPTEPAPAEATLFPTNQK
jgi:hypothetical protein